MTSNPVAQAEIEYAAAEVRRSADALDADATRPDIPAGAAERKRAAANDLRTYADQIATGDRKYNAAEADLMATAGRASGIVMDGRSGVEAQLQQSDSWVSPEMKREIRDQYDQRRAALDKLVRDGRMVRVDEEGQVPFYALASYGGWTRDEVAARDAADVDEPAP